MIDNPIFSTFFFYTVQEDRLLHRIWGLGGQARAEFFIDYTPEICLVADKLADISVNIGKGRRRSALCICTACTTLPQHFNI